MNFYKIHLNWTKQFVRDNIDLIEKNYSLYPYRNKWDCNVHSIHDYECDDVYRIDYNFLRKRYEKVVKEVCKTYDINDYHLSDIWYNYYKKGQYQEPHIHEGNGGLAAVHYLIFDPLYHFPTQFPLHPNSPQIECGDILFFPASWSHYVPVNKIESPRLTVAFTITRS